MKISYYCRKIHRFCVVIMLILGIPMILSGISLKYRQFALFTPLQARLIHSALSTYFIIVLTIMMITGLVMYLVPWILKLRAKSLPN